MKKRTYEQPKVTVVELESSAILAASGEATFSLDNATVEQGNNGDWSDTNLDW